MKNQHQRAHINSIHKKIMKIPDYHDVSKELLNIWIENLLKNSRTRNKPNRGNPSFTLNDVTIEILIHHSFYFILHVETPSTKYNLQTPNNSQSAIRDTRNTRTNNYYGTWLFIYRSDITRGWITSLVSFRTYCLSSTSANSIWKQVISW